MGVDDIEVTLVVTYQGHQIDHVAFHFQVQIDDQFNFEPREQRVTFVVGGEVFALKLGNSKLYEHFLQRCNRAMFENRFGVESSAQVSPVLPVTKTSMNV